MNNREMLIGETEVELINRWILDRWKFTFEVPRFLMIERFIRYPPLWY